MRTPPAEVWVNVWCTDNDNRRQVGISYCEPIFVNEEDVMDFTEAVEDMLPGLEEFPSLTLKREARAQSSTPREAVYEELAADAQVPAPASPTVATSSMLYRSELSASLVPGQSAPLELTTSL